MHSRQVRVTRGLLAASVSTFVAALSHASAGGSEPSTVAVLLSLVLAAFVCIALAGRRVTPWRTAIAVLLSQVFYHALFTAIPASSTSAEAVFGVSAAHVHGSGAAASASVSLAGSVAGPGMAMSHTAHGHGVSLTMWAAHALAALITVAVVLYGERAFWRLFDTLRMSLLVLFRPIPSASTPLRVAVPVVVRRVLSPVPAPFLSSVKHRGPPRGCSAVFAA